jgi:hypothetical protein
MKKENFQLIASLIIMALQIVTLVYAILIHSLLKEQISAKEDPCELVMITDTIDFKQNKDTTIIIPLTEPTVTYNGDTLQKISVYRVRYINQKFKDTGIVQWSGSPHIPYNKNIDGWTLLDTIPEEYYSYDYK